MEGQSMEVDRPCIYNADGEIFDYEPQRVLLWIFKEIINARKAIAPVVLPAPPQSMDFLLLC